MNEGSPEMEADLDLLFQALNEHLTDEQMDFALDLEEKLCWRPLRDHERRRLRELVEELHAPST